MLPPVTRYRATALFPEEAYTGLLVAPEMGATKLFQPFAKRIVTLVEEIGVGLGALGVTVGPGGKGVEVGGSGTGVLVAVGFDGGVGTGTAPP